MPSFAGSLRAIFIVASVSYSFAQMSSKNAISSFTTNEKYVFLTFDDGPHSNLTPKLLDVLKLKNVKATFFVIGLKAKMHPKILARMSEEGHEIANHSWNHPVLSTLDYSEVLQQLQTTNSAIFDASNKTPAVMRPPYGNTNGKLNEYMRDQQNLKVILWSIDTKDWKRPNPQDIVKVAMAKAKPGDIILCHDIHPGTIAAIPDLIDGLQAKGFKFLTISQMFTESNETTGHRNLRGNHLY